MFIFLLLFLPIFFSGTGFPIYMCMQLINQKVDNIIIHLVIIINMKQPHKVAVHYAITINTLQLQTAINFIYVYNLFKYRRKIK
jgi:hypothetical protein